MKRGVKRWLGTLAVFGGAGAAALLLVRRVRGTAAAGEEEAMTGKRPRGWDDADVWARPGMSVTFRAELRPGRSRAERTFRVERVLPSGRVTLRGFAGEHTETEFEPER